MCIYPIIFLLYRTKHSIVMFDPTLTNNKALNYFEYM